MSSADFPPTTEDSQPLKVTIRWQMHGPSRLLSRSGNPFQQWGYSDQQSWSREVLPTQVSPQRITRATTLLPTSGKRWRRFPPHGRVAVPGESRGSCTLLAALPVRLAPQSTFSKPTVRQPRPGPLSPRSRRRSQIQAQPTSTATFIASAAPMTVVCFKELSLTTCRSISRSGRDQADSHLSKQG